MRKLLRLWVMTKINHTEEYYKNAMFSSGADIKNLTHNQIVAYKATMKSIEADILIETAFAKDNVSKLSEVDISVFKPCKTVY